MTGRVGYPGSSPGFSTLSLFLPFFLCFTPLGCVPSTSSFAIPAIYCYITSQDVCVYVCVLSSFSHVGFLATLWTVAHQAPLSMGFSRQEYWSGLPCPPPGDLPDPEIESASALSGRFFTTSTTWEGPSCHTTVIKARREVSPCTVPSIRRKTCPETHL